MQYTDTTSRQLCMSAVRFVNGAVYDGEWNKGKKHGKGVFSYPDGSKYDGTIQTHGTRLFHYINQRKRRVCINEAIKSTYIFKRLTLR